MMMHTLINRVIYFSFSSNDLHGQADLKKLDRVMSIFYLSRMQSSLSFQITLLYNRQVVSLKSLHE